MKAMGPFERSNARPAFLLVRALTSLVLFWLMTSSAWATIATDSTSSQTVSNAASVSWQHTVSGDNRILLVSAVVSLIASDGSVTPGPPMGVALATYAGIPMQPLGQSVEHCSFGIGGGVPYPLPTCYSAAVQTWYLVAPPQGTAAIAINFGSSYPAMIGMAASFSGVSQTTPIGLINSPSTEAANSWIVSFAGFVPSGLTIGPPAGPLTALSPATVPVSLNVGGMYEAVGTLATTTPDAYSISWLQDGNPAYPENLYSLELIDANSTVPANPIALDSTSMMRASDSSMSWTHVCGGSRRLLAVASISTSFSPATPTATTVTSMTYGGQPLQQAGTVFQQNGTVRIELWYLVNPPTGANTISVTYSGPTLEAIAAAASFNGAAGITVGSTASFPQGQPLGFFGASVPPLTLSSVGNDLILVIGANTSPSYNPMSEPVSLAGQFTTATVGTLLTGQSGSYSINWSTSYSTSIVAGLAVEFTVDTVPPTITGLNPPNNSLVPVSSLSGGTLGGNLTITGSVVDPQPAPSGVASVSCNGNAATLTPSSGAGPLAFSCQVPITALGSQAIDIIATDVAGNASTVRDNVTITATPALSVTLTATASVSPSTTISYTATVQNSGSGPASTVTLAATLPDGSTATPTFSPPLAPGGLPAGSSAQATFSYQVPAIAAKTAGETTAAYLTRLAAQDGTSLTGSVSATWTDSSGHSYGPVNMQAMSVRRVPVIGTAASTSAPFLPGSTATVNATLQNTGSTDGLQTVFQVTNPDASTTSSTPITVPAGQTASVATSWTVPFVPKQTGETDGSYQGRLASLDNRTLNFATAVSWQDRASNLYGPTKSIVTSTEVMPIFTVSLSGPGDATSGATIGYSVAVQNIGHAAGTPSISLTMPDGTIVTPTLSPSGAIAAGASATASANFAIPTSLSGTKMATASLTWTDANNNSYGTQSASVATLIAPAIVLTVSAGSNQSVSTPQDLALQGSVSVMPATTVASVAWTKVSGPGTVTFSNPQSPTSVAQFTVAGTYDLRLTATANSGGAQMTQSSDVTITATAGTSQAPTVNAGSNQTVIQPNTTATVSGTVSDPNGSFTTAWTQVAGPSATITSPSSTTTQVTMSTTGIYAFKLTATDSQFTASSIVTVTLKPSSADAPPIVNAGPNQNVIMPSAPNNLPYGPQLQTVSTFTNSAQAVTYHQPTNRVLASVNYATGNPFNFELLAPDGTTSQFTTIHGLGDEVYTIAARDEGGGKSIGGFPAGTTFTGNGVAGQIERISPDGLTITNPWVTLPGETALLRGQVTIDRTGVWNGDLIVIASDATHSTASVWRVVADGNPNAGTATKLASLNLGPQAEGVVVVPNDLVRWGPWAGKIVVGGESSTNIFAIDTLGNVTSFNFGIGSLEFMEMVQPNENFYAVDLGAGKFVSMPATELATLAGDILVGTETNSGVGPIYDIHWNSLRNEFEVTPFTQGNSFEGATMAPMALEGIAGVTATATLNGTVTDAAPVGTLTYAWSKTSGPGTATFTNPSGTVTSPTSPATTVSFGLPGTYVLQLTGSDSLVSATSQTTVTIQGNAPPVVNPGPEQQGMPGSPVTLPGVVTDDGLPSGGALSVFWTLLAGPGSVTFGSTKSTWDSALDFTAALNSSGLAPNPNGAWSYGWEATRSGTFTLLGNEAINNGMPTFFISSVSLGPQVFYNPTPSAIRISSSQSVPPLTVVLSPDSSGNAGVLRWTAPAAGSYLVQGDFLPTDSATNPVWITLTTGSSSSTLFTNNLGVRTSNGIPIPAAAPFQFVRQFSAGDTLDFVAGLGPSGGSQTRVNVTITASMPAMTTATFAQGGDYILRLIAFDGQLYGYGDIHESVVAACDTPPSGIISWWSGDSSTADIAGTNNGTATGSLGFANGIVGQAFTFDGLSAGVTVPQSTSLNTSSITIEGWINPTSVATEVPLIEYRSASSQGLLVEMGVGFAFGAGFISNPGGLFVDFHTGSTFQMVNTPSGVIVANQWNHFAMTYDHASGKATLYVNGIAWATGQFGSDGNLSLPLQIGFGNTDSNGSQFYKGLMDEPAIYNRALSAAEVLAIYSAGQSGKCKGLQPLTVNAGANQFTILPSNSIGLNGSVSVPAGQTPTIAWSEVSGPGVHFGQTNLAATTATVTAPGTYVLRLTATTANATTTSDTTVTVFPVGSLPPTSPSVDAGNSQTVQLGNPPSTVNATLTGSVSSPAGPATLGWSEVSGPAPVTFSSLNQLSTTVTFATAGTYVLQLSAAVPGAAQASSFVTVTVLPPPLQPPVVSAGPYTSVQLPNTTVTLNGSAHDLGGNSLTLAWSQLSGPATAAFGTPTQAVTTATLSTAGTYVLQLSASNAQYTSTSSVTAVVVPAGATNTAPVVNAGSNQTVNLPTITATLNGTASDDGLPVGAGLAINWALVSGPGAVTFANSHAATTQVTLSATGSYLFQLSVSDSALTTTATTTVTLQEPPNQAPVVTVPSNFSVQLPSGAVALNGTATDDGLPLGSALRVTWSSSPSTVSFANANAAVTSATFPAAGTYTLTLSATDSSLTANRNVTVTVLAAPAPPTVSLNLSDATEITQPTAIIGSVSGGNWTVKYALYNSASQTQTYTALASGSTAVSNGTLATLDPTLLLNGSYQLLLTSVDNVGQISTVSAMVTVSRNMKIGVFSLAFNDMTVPLAGLPITVTRSYDSRDKTVGDFGVGWHVAVTNIRLQKNHPLSANWLEDLEYSALSPRFCISSTNTKIVTVVFPNNTVYKFQAQASPQCQQFLSITNPTLTFQQVQATAGTQGATLAPLDGGSALIDGSPPAAINLIGLDGNLYDPTTFVLTLANGLSYTIDQVTGLLSMRDLNGNTLTFSANGITSSTGTGVTLLRDSQGRITKITDPNGNSSTYGYTGADLTSYTDRTTNTTTFSYAPGDYLTSITLPNGQSGLSAAYDPATNRLTSTTDGLGKSIGMSYNTAANTQTVTDRNGNATTYVYDQDGNIVQTTDALMHVTSSTYDNSDQKLSDTDALGRITSYTYDAAGNLRFQKDSLGNVTGYTYNTLNKPLTITDPLGNVTINAYDTHGNLFTTTDAVGNLTTNAYNPNGTLQSTTDANSKTTSFTYDNNGNLLRQTDPLGIVTRNTYDNNGNRLMQSVTRTFQGSPQVLVTHYTYDGQNRLTQTTFPDTTFTQTHYNNLGQVDLRTDELGHQTQYQYDGDGRLTTTTYADNTTDITQYDFNGNRTQTTNRGIVTSFAYDQINRLTQTVAAPNTSNAATTLTGYDAASQVTSTTDARSNVTHYAYDNAGRRTSVQNALNQVTVFTYDAAGNQLAVKDANSNVTTSSYDADNRLVKTTYPDGKFDSTAYDPVGRVSSRTDANGKVTQYGYDALGRLTSVTDPLNQVTSYGYDEVGNRISQTDANLHTTNYQYDQRGRRIGRTLPAGQSESYAYDNAGNLHTRTDFNNKTTTYGYDTLNRLLSKTPDASFNASPVSFTYTTTGKRQTMIDPSGTTTYGYDNRDRLTSKATPEGTLTYNYDLASNLTVLSTTGLTVNYTYDVLNRLSTVAEPNTGTTSYSYDAVGNLASFATPNGVSHGYSYDTRNRLANLAVGTATPLASYAYTLDAAGHRTSVAELSGRNVAYTYDNIYRLMSETVSGVAASGAVSYTYDAVGNRKTLTSTLAPIQSTTSNFDSDDRLSTDGYDPNGNTTQSAGATYAYDFENHLLSTGAIAMVYDGDGNRVKKNNTTYMVDDLNPTGYAQVIVETTPSEIRQFVYGLERLSQRRSTTVSYYGYDGHGSVRLLTDPTGTVTDTYDYDAFGNIVNSSGVTPNEFLFAAEQYESDLGLYYNRARYYNTTSGRFWTMDDFEGNDEEPVSLHKYLYVGADPVDNVDPCGKCLVSNVIWGRIVERAIFEDFLKYNDPGRFTNAPISEILRPQPAGWLGGSLRPDLADVFSPLGLFKSEVYEIKSELAWPEGAAKVASYKHFLNKYDKIRTWVLGRTYTPPDYVPIEGTSNYALVNAPVSGVITYCVVSNVDFWTVFTVTASRGIYLLGSNLGSATRIAGQAAQAITGELGLDFGVAASTAPATGGAY